MFRHYIFATLTAALTAAGLCGSVPAVSAGEPVKARPLANRAPESVRAFERELTDNPKFAKQVARAAKSGDKKALLKLIDPYVPTADVESLAIDSPTSKHVRVIKIKIVIKGGNGGEVNVPINP
ncbi:hypothetical protein J8F10_27515 [Gemmata sp. G18]|uniref:HEAT repeat domain-containing protein n=1 Tax=Gemmata palustris TaxID=2822762 RepID=A0ABS5BZ61_9BACT|nr:hypothetical protein [Gemmata palustris]MBP3959009.1 hypothetical protein [Gemmata palustris]